MNARRPRWLGRGRNLNDNCHNIAVPEPLEAAGEFVDEKGGGPGVRLRKPLKAKSGKYAQQTATFAPRKRGADPRPRDRSRCIAERSSVASEGKVKRSIRAIGRSRGGCARKNHTFADSECWPIALMLSADQIVDCTAGELVLEDKPKAFTFTATKGFDSDATRC
jgi:hypothetical protein